jgi:hypothetical protein
MANTVDNRGIFNLNTARDFLYCLEVALKKYKNTRAKRIQDALFLIMGATHLREWIAPGYSPKFSNNQPSPAPRNKAEKFYIEIFDNLDFKIVQGLCNRAKHLSGRSVATDYTNGLSFDECDCPIDDVVANFDEGPPTGFFVEDMEIGEILNRLLDEYQHKWFDRECT